MMAIRPIPITSKAPMPVAAAAAPLTPTKVAIPENE